MINNCTLDKYQILYDTFKNMVQLSPYSKRGKKLEGSFVSIDPINPEDRIFIDKRSIMSINLDGTFTRALANKKGVLRVSDNSFKINTQQDYKHKGVYFDTDKNEAIQYHQIVAFAYFMDQYKKLTDPVVNHLDGNKQNNKPSNLEWCTHEQNVMHGVLLQALSGTPFSEDVVYDNGNTERVLKQGCSIKWLLAFNKKHPEIKIERRMCHDNIKTLVNFLVDEGYWYDTNEKIPDTYKERSLLFKYNKEHPLDWSLFLRRLNHISQ